MTLIIEKCKSIYAMCKKNEPVLRVPSGSTVVFETYDCFQNQIEREEQGIDTLNWEHINPATGPLYIEGAEVGDTLKVIIEKIEIAEQGVMAAIPGAGIFGEEVTHSQIKVVPIKEGKAIFNEEIHIPVKPMIGVIGVAPAGEGIPCGVPGAHGGNMDNKKIQEGTILYLPVFAPGALLAMGDLHAVMGDGEIMVSGVEIPGHVKVRVEVLKGKQIQNPILEDEEHYYAIASAEELLTAVKLAAKDMQGYICQALNLSFNEAGMLLSAVGDAQICQVVDPLLTVRFAMPKAYVKKLL